MRKKPLASKLFPTYFIITLASVLVIGLYASNALHDFYYSRAESDLEVRARLIRPDIEAHLVPLNRRELSNTVHDLAKQSGTRITVIDRSGVVIADSESDPSKMENHSDRPEFRRAIAGRAAVERRPSPTLDITMLYAAIPIRRNGETTAVLRTALAATALDAAPGEAYRRIAVGAALIALFAGAVSLLAARRIGRPLSAMKHAAARFADGDLHSRVPPADTEELASLAEALNQMAAQLDRQVRTITQQAGEQQAILSSMKEAVVAIDNDDRILILNSAAERLLGVRIDSARGKTIQEAIRSPDLQRFFGRLRSSDEPMTDEFVMRSPGERIMQVTGTSLVGADGNEIGVLVVLDEVTQTRKLEGLRRDFVANVSHELKTPITSIKGFVETLREGALDDPEKARDFLDIIGRQADRLDAIIEDLLALSKIERDAEAAEIALEPTPVKRVLQAAVADCAPKASATGVEVTVECDEGITANINPPLLQQALANLIDNAIKYSPGGAVRIAAERLDAEVAIRVEDNGCGIEPEHIPRLFERFYRVDKARSRKLGGTGLGLAIVKHIVQAHHGRVVVRSTPGRGSTFSVFLPGGPGQTSP